MTICSTYESLGMPRVPPQTRAYHANRNKKAVFRAVKQLCAQGKFKVVLCVWNEDNNNTLQSKVQMMFSESMFEDSCTKFFSQAIAKFFHAAKRSAEMRQEAVMAINVRVNEERVLPPLQHLRIDSYVLRCVFSVSLISFFAFDLLLFFANRNVITCYI